MLFTMPPSPRSSSLLTIGALSRATGIPTPTLRTWERRYGVPTSTRTEGGHRLYEPSEVERLRLVGRALSNGHRAHQVLGADLATLRAWAGAPSEEPGAAPPSGSIELAQALDGPALDARLRHEWARLGAAAFLSGVVVPLARDVGEAWRRGELAVHQEHFATHRLLAFIHARWRELAEGNAGLTGVFATLPGEHHEIGLAMSALTVAHEGWKVTYLGCDCPLSELVASTRASGASALFLSVSAVADPATAQSQIAWVVSQLGDTASVVVGGEGAPDVAGALILRTLDDLRSWLRAR